MRLTKLLRPGRARKQAARPALERARVLRRPDLRKDFAGESSLRLSAEALFDAFESGRPSSRELLRTRTCWPVGFEADRSNLGGVLYQPLGLSLPINDLDHRQRSGILGHLPEDVDAAPASSLVLESAIDFVQLGLAVEDVGIKFASLINSETELRVGSGLRCQLASGDSSEGQDRSALALIENHANFDGNSDPLQQVLLSTLELIRDGDILLLSQAKNAVRSLSRGEGEAARALSQLAALLRSMRSPQMASFASHKALDQPYARLAVLDLNADESQEQRYRIQEARKQVEVEDWLESLDHFDRKREIDWLEELHGGRDLFINDHRPDHQGALTLGQQALDPIAADFISDRNHNVMSRALHGQLGDALFDPLARHMIQMEINDREPPTLEYLWGSWDPERGAFPIRLSCSWPEDLDVQAARIERVDDVTRQFWLQPRDFEDPDGAITDSVAPSRAGTVSYRAAWLSELPGSEARGKWSPSRDVVTPTVPNRFVQYFAKLRGPNALDHVVDDLETLQRRVRRTRKARKAVLRTVARSAAFALAAAVSWIWVFPAVLDAAGWLIGLV